MIFYAIASNILHFKMPQMWERKFDKESFSVCIRKQHENLTKQIKHLCHNIYTLRTEL